MNRAVSLIILFLLGLSAHSRPRLDSLLKVNPETDVQKVNLFIALSKEYQLKGSLNSAQNYAEQALAKSKESDWLSGQAKSYNQLAYVAIYNSDYETAMKRAISALELAESERDSSNQALAYQYIGYVNTTLGEFETAKEFYFKALSIQKELESSERLGFIYTYIANLYRENNQLDSALFYHQRALVERSKTNNPRSKADSYLLIGGTYYKKGAYQKAIEYCINALGEYLKLNDKKRLGETYRQLAEIKLKLGKEREAELYLKEAVKFAKESKALDNVVLIYEELSKLKEIEGEYEKALDYLKRRYKLEDSIASKKVYQEASKSLLKYKVNKEKRIKELLREQEKREQKLINYAIFAGSFLVLTFAVFVVQRLRITRRQKQEISLKTEQIQYQKEELEDSHSTLQLQHQEIQSSIVYAKRIQGAILPSLKLVKTYLKQSFILYKPKDVVAGDFYWFTSASLSTGTSTPLSAITSDFERPPAGRTGSREADVIYFAAADCTGHGVPGAMVSVVCNNALNRSVKEFGLTERGEILDKTRELVIKEFEKSEEEVQDGMDIALCSLNLKGTSSARLPDGQGAEKPLLKYAGAHNPLWLIRKGKFDEATLPAGSRISDSENGAYQLAEIKADKQPIGKYETTKPYTTHTFELEQGDTLYLFSDGFVDQFGGEKGKKFKSLNFKRLLLSIQELDMEAQRREIDKTFEEWKKGLEQIDDVCVIGICI